jgi:hypothetical protein
MNLVYRPEIVRTFKSPHHNAGEDQQNPLLFFQVLWGCAACRPNWSVELWG